MTETNNKEIDLIELYQKILVFVSRKILIFTIFILIGLLFGTAYYYKKSNIVKTDYLIEVSDISKKIIYNLTDKIKFSVETQNFEVLNQNLKLDNDILRDIQRINIDTTSNILNLSIISSSKKTVLPFTQALVKYYNQQKYILEKHEKKINETKDLLGKIEEEIESINKMQNLFLSENRNSNVTINQIDGSHSEKLRLYKMKQKCEEILSEEQLIKLINKDNNVVRNNYSLLKILITSIFISILFAFVYFFIQFSIALKNKA